MNCQTYLRKLFAFLEYAFGMGFMLFSFFLLYQTSEIYYLMAAMVSFMFAFTSADRNVYRNRLSNLKDALSESDMGIELEADGYTDYKITQEDDEEQTSL